MNIAKRREYMKKYQREWMAARRAEWFKDKKCAVCGTHKNLDLDHIDPSTKVHHRIWSWAKERREAELAKCQALCEKHHQEKTNRDNGFGMKHGTSKGYVRYGCRCNQCRRAEIDRVNQYRWRTGRRRQRSGVAQPVEQRAVNAKDSGSTPLT